MEKSLEGVGAMVLSSYFPKQILCYMQKIMASYLKYNST
jgi:hypothetical protein